MTCPFIIAKTKLMKIRIGSTLYQKGFTLIEMIITLVIASILILVAIPSLNEMIRENRTASEANRLMRDLNFARSEAVQRGISVSLCRSNSGAGCAGDDWQSGWIIFTDLADDGTFNDADELLQVNEGLEGGFTLPVSDEFDDGITFRPDGSVNGPANGTFEIRPAEGDSRQIDISASGRVSVSLILGDEGGDSDSEGGSGDEGGATHGS